MEYVWKIFGTCLEYVRIRVEYLEYDWNILGIFWEYLEYVWNILGICLELEYVWNMFGFEHVWNMSGMS